MRNVLFTCFVALPLLIVGCGPENEVVKLKGKITFADGKPLPEGTRIAFRPLDNARKSSMGITKSDGTFEMEHETGTNGAEIGKYKIAVLPPEGQEAAFGKIVPAAYINAEVLSVDVKSGMADLDLKIQPMRKR